MTNEPVREPTRRDRKPRLSRARWEAECLLMAKYFPEFTPYAADGVVGFRGKLRGPRTGRTYTITVQAWVTEYPAHSPAVYIDPRPEGHHYLHDGRLDMCSPRKPGDPARNTFASRLLVTVTSVAAFDNNNQDRISPTSTGEQEQ